jgi:hypothetical protein
MASVTQISPTGSATPALVLSGEILPDLNTGQRITFSSASKCLGLPREVLRRRDIAP